MKHITTPEINAFFSRSIVGGPVSLVLGESVKTRDLIRVGMEVAPDSFVHRLSKGWFDAMALEHIDSQTGVPRKQPSRLRKFLYRQAPSLVLLSLVLFGSAVALFIYVGAYV
jgi:hypothetical protein